MNDKLKYLNDSDLTGIEIGKEKFSIKLTFTIDQGTKVIFLELANIIYFSFSNTLDDVDIDFIIFEVKLEKINDGGESILSRLSYGFFDSKSKKTLSYPERELYYLHIEGDIVIDIVCGEYSVESNH